MRGQARFVSLLVAGVFALGASATAAPPGASPGSPGGFSFRVEIEGITSAGFSEVSGLSSTTEVVEFRSGSDPEAVRKVPGETRYADIVLTASPDNPALDALAAWHRQIVDGTLERRNGTVIVLDRDGTEVIRYNFTEAWPSGWKMSTLAGKGTDTEVLVEEVTLTVEGIFR